MLKQVLKRMFRNRRMKLERCKQYDYNHMGRCWSLLTGEGNFLGLVWEDEIRGEER